VRRAVSLTSGIIGWGIQGGEPPTLHYADIARFPGIGLIGFGMGFRALTNVKNTDRMSDSAPVGGPSELREALLRTRPPLLLTRRSGRIMLRPGFKLREAR